MGKRRDESTSRGTTTVAEAVVSKVAGMAAQEVDGIRMGGSASQTAGSLLSSVTGGGGTGRTQGVSVEVGSEEAAVDLTLSVEYAKSVPQLTKSVRDNVIKRIEGLTGLRVTEVNVNVTDVYFPNEE